MLIGNFLIAVVWASLIGPFTPVNLLIGFVLGYGVLRLCVGRADTPGYARRSAAVVSLAGFTVYELMVANVRVAWYTISSLKTLRPAVLRTPLEPDLTDTEITLLSTLITLTPGTLTVDVAPDRSALFVHFMHVEDVDDAIASIKTGFERRILEVTR